MEIYKLDELIVFIMCFVAGMCICAVFDMFRAIRKMKKFSDKAVAGQDALFWIIACAVLFGALYISNGAELRWYEPIGIVMGVCVYCLALSAFFMMFYGALLRFFSKTFKMLLVPVKAFFHWLKRMSERLASPFFVLKCRILYILHKLIPSRSKKYKRKIKNIWQKFFFTFLKR